MSDLFSEPEDADLLDRITGRRTIGLMPTAVHVSKKSYDYLYCSSPARVFPILVQVRARALKDLS